MLRFDISNTISDISRFMHANRLKFLFGFILCVLGAIGGVANALGITEVTRQGLMRFNVFLVITGERSFWGYFFFRFLLLFGILFIISIFTCRPAFSWLAFIVLILFSYQAAFFISIMFMYASFVVLPLMLVVIVPFLLFTIYIFMYYISFLIETTRRCPVIRLSDIPYYITSISGPFLLASIVIVILSLIESALVLLLTMGITL